MFHLMLAINIHKYDLSFFFFYFIPYFAVKCKLCISHAFRTRCRGCFEKILAWEFGPEIGTSFAFIGAYHARTSGKGSRAAWIRPRLLSRIPRATHPVSSHSLAAVRSLKEARKPRRAPLPGCIPARAYFNINNWRANFPRARARVISGRRDGDASVCDRDPAASRRLRHSVSLPILFSSPRCLFLR